MIRKTCFPFLVPRLICEGWTRADLMVRERGKRLSGSRIFGKCGRVNITCLASRNRGEIREFLVFFPFEASDGRELAGQGW